MIWYFRALAKYAVFTGRARRREYWYFYLFYLVFALILGGIIGLMHLTDHTELITRLYQFAFLLPILAVGVRRMHDVNKSGWYIIVPIYNLILACTDGTHGPNDYGPDPKDEAPTLYGAADYERPFDINPE
jgi:uncharacterized membrane protein YhaH (DUF805 family)